MTDAEARLAAALLAALKDTGYLLTHEYGDGGVYDVADAMTAADPTLAADLALAAAVRDIEVEFHPLRAIAATSGTDGWELSAEGYNLAGTIVYRSGQGQTLAAAIIEAAKEAERES